MRQDGRRDCFLGFVAGLLTCTCLAVTVVAFIGVTRAGAQLTSMVFTSKKRTPPTAGARGHSFALPARDEQSQSKVQAQEGYTHASVIVREQPKKPLQQLTTAWAGPAAVCKEPLHQFRNMTCGQCVRHPKGGSCYKCKMGGYDCSCTKACKARANAWHAAADSKRHDEVLTTAQTDSPRLDCSSGDSKLACDRSLAWKYAAWLRPPEEIKRRNPSYVLNTPGPPRDTASTHQKVRLMRDWTAALGVARLLTTGLRGAKELAAAGESFFYLTLLNDHLPTTERAHDAAVAWSRSLDHDRVHFVGLPGKFQPDAERKLNHCLQSELTRRKGGQRFALPCAVSDMGANSYQALRREQDADAAAAGIAHGPIWLTRPLETGREGHVMTMGMGIQIRDASFLQRDDHLKALAEGGYMLMRYLDPPLLHHNVHLGRPVSVRVDSIRIFGVVQWEPLRVWVSRHGATLSGTPFANYTGRMEDWGMKERSWKSFIWKVNQAQPACGAQAVSSAARKTVHERCNCSMIGQTVDDAHGERGFSTVGTHLTLDNVARGNGLKPSALWQSVDEALTGYFVAEQTRLQEEDRQSDEGRDSRNRSPSRKQADRLARWTTPFSTDVGFSADGRANLYEVDVAGPTWKSAHHFESPSVSRALAFGVYSTLAMPMATELVAEEADEYHRRQIRAVERRSAQDSTKDGLNAEDTNESSLLNFLRTQALAAAFGLRRAWPSSPSKQLRRVLAPRDRAFARELRRMGMLLPSLEAGASTSADQVPKQAWPLWQKAMADLLYRNGSSPPLCIQHEAIVAEFDARASAEKTQPAMQPAKQTPIK